MKGCISLLSTLSPLEGQRGESVEKAFLVACISGKELTIKSEVFQNKLTKLHTLTVMLAVFLNLRKWCFIYSVDSKTVLS